MKLATKIILLLFILLTQSENRIIEESEIVKKINYIKFSVPNSLSINRLNNLIDDINSQPKKNQGEFLFALGNALIYSGHQVYLNEIALKLINFNSFNYTPDFNSIRGQLFYSLYFIQSNNLREALKYALNAKANSLEIENKALVYLSTSILVEIYTSFYNYYKAQEECIEAHAIAVNMSRVDWEAKCNSYFAILAYFLKDYPEAIRYHKLALVQSTSLNDFDNIALANCNIGGCYLALNNLQQAKAHYLEALNFIKNITPFNASTFASIIDNLNYIKIKQNKSGDLNGFIYAEKLRNKYKIVEGRSTHNLLQGLSYKELANFNLAIEKLKIAYLDSTVALNYQHRLFILKELIHIDLKFSKEHFSSFLKINNSRLSFQRSSRNKFARTAYEAQQLADERDKAERDNVLIAGSGSAISLGLLLLLSAKIQRARRRRVLLEKKRAESEVSMYKVLIDNQLLKAKAGIHQKHLLARELHDGVMNHLASTRLNLYQIHQEAKVNPVAHRKRFAEEIAKIEEELASIALRLDNTPLSLKELVSTLVQQHAQASEPLVRLLFEDSPHVETIDREVVATLYRILQETLHNAFKHACAKQILISFSANSSRVYFQILDDGKGFREENHQNGIGIRNIKNRVAELRGTIAINSGNGGTSIVIEIPTLPAA